MYSPNYQNDYFPNLIIVDKTIGMVLFQEEDGIEHMIYYLSRNLNEIEVKYSYVENKAMAAVQAI